MSLPLSAEDETRYTAIIDAILATADLTTVTRKKIRMGLERALGGKDLREQKDAIKKLIEERFDTISAVKDSPPADLPPSSLPARADDSPERPLNGHSNSHGRRRRTDSDAEAEADGADDVDDAEDVAPGPPSKKKRRREAVTEDADAKLAAKLQAQENLRATTRATRGSGTGTAAPKKKKQSKTARKKSEKKARAGDDSGVDSSEDLVPKRKAGGGFQKPLNLSFALAELCGEPQLPRTTVVKKLWQHIKANDLQDPQDKRQIRCDDKMYAVFKQARMDMFQMNKLVGNHLYPVDE